MSLREEQVWMVGAITGAALDAANPERYVTPGPRMTAAERFDVYRSGYRARLVECLLDDYPAVGAVLGEERFEALCADYMDRFPSNSPNLNWFGRHMAGLLRERSETFLAELAALEWAMVEAIHADLSPPLEAAKLAELPIEAWETARFGRADGVRLLRSEHDVNAFFQAFKTGDELPPLPARSETPAAVVVYRKDLRIWRMPLTPPMASVLEPLLEGKTFAEALADLDEKHGPSVMIWFRDWVAEGLFSSLTA